MKISLLALTLAIATLQTPSVLPPAGPAPSAPVHVPLSAAECKCSVEVTVKRTTRGEPLRDAKVSIARYAAISVDATAEEAGAAMSAATKAANTGKNFVTVTTDINGRAVFRDLAEGEYTFEARCDGYFGDNDRYSTQALAYVSVVPSKQGGASGTRQQTLKQGTLNMIQGAAISGRVQDANHDPASGVPVGVLGVSYQYGHRVLTDIVSSVETDDRGEYRLSWFPPGEYYVHTIVGSYVFVRPSQFGASVSSAYGRSGTNHQATSYYPGTVDPRSAVPVWIREGSDLTGIDIALPAKPGVTISGTIINTLPGGRGASQGFLVPRNPSFSETPYAMSIGPRGQRGDNTPNDSQSVFEIRDVPPGTYDFYPLYSGAVTAETGTSRSAYYTARTSIEVGTEDITGIQSVIRPGTNLKGHVTIIGSPPPIAAGRPAQTMPPSSIQIQIQPKDNIPSSFVGQIASITVDADGGFNVANIIDGQYFISNQVLTFAPDAYVSEIRQDGHSVFDDGLITIGNQPQSILEIIISRGGGTIQGVVQDAQHKPLPSVRITLIPDIPRRENLLLYKAVTSNPEGKFSLTGIAPGNYKLFAWERDPAGGEKNAEFMRDYDVIGVSVNVVAGLPLANIQVQLIPAKR